MVSCPPPRRANYAGLFIVAMTTLMYEILLTRIFSVTMWYHFAFLAISVAMFGMTVGAIAVYLWPGFFTHERTERHLALSALLFSISMAFSFLTHLSIPFITGKTLVLVYAVAFNYAVLATPFFFSGICICLALTRHPRHVGGLYAADLAGAAAGCVLLILLLRATDGPSAVFFIAALAAAGAICFVPAGAHRKLRAGIAAALGFAAFATANTILSQMQHPALRVLWVKGAFEERGLFTKWNSFSRIHVNGDPEKQVFPAIVGITDKTPTDFRARELNLTIDANAATVLTHFDGDLTKVDYLKYDVMNLVHYLRPDANVLVVGAGGGRDVLSALAFKQRSVRAVEINDNILKAVNEKFGDFTGHLDRLPNVRFINDEARSTIVRLKEPVDAIQISLIDTWAATAAGAFVMTENSLYTVEAWKIFLSHLSDKGILTLTRWYFADRPAEIYRLVSLASESLHEMGVANPRAHIILVRAMKLGVGTILISRNPFTADDLKIANGVCEKMGFEVVLTPEFSLDPTIERIASRRDLDELYKSYPLKIAPPTDDSPFFFHVLRLRDFFRANELGFAAANFNMKAIFLLGVLVAVVFTLSALCIFVPLLLTARGTLTRGVAMPMFYFTAIGLGFMFVEISQMQRLIVFLGHPTYGLSVALFSLLLASGAGSFAAPRMEGPGSSRAALARLGLLLAVLAAFGVLTPQVIAHFQAAGTPMRILLAMGLLFPIGFFMGMAFPMGMGLALRRSPGIAPWLWGINGAMSVLASVLAVVAALTWGIAASFWIGVACYGGAAAAFAAMGRSREN